MAVLSLPHDYEMSFIEIDNAPKYEIDEEAKKNLKILFKQLDDIIEEMRKNGEFD